MIVFDALKNFFLESESEFIALQLEDPAEGGVATEEDCHLAHLLLPDLGEDFVPVGTTCVGPRLESSHQISFFLEYKRINNNKTNILQNIWLIVVNQSMGNFIIQFQDAVSSLVILWPPVTSILYDLGKGSINGLVH